MDAYARGVNDFVKNMKVYPLEFYILWTDFPPWTVEDSLAVHALL
jgi:acyl-homoserine lactone acylase PvdQ